MFTGFYSLLHCVVQFPAIISVQNNLSTTKPNFLEITKEHYLRSQTKPKLSVILVLCKFSVEVVLVVTFGIVSFIAT